MFRFPLMKGHKTFRRLKNKYNEELEPQEVLLDKLARKKEEEFGISEKKFEVPLSKKILQGFLIFTIILIFGLFIKTFQLQVLENKKFLEAAEKNKFIIHSIKAARGVIYDSKGNQLVFNNPSFDLILDKKKLPQSDLEKIRILKEISEIIKKNFKDLEYEINKTDEQQIVVSENLDHQTLIILETRIADLPGFQIENNPIREYQDSKSFAHLIGYTGKISAEELKENPEVYSVFDYTGKEGLEKSYEEVLRKKAGKLRLERDVYGNLLSEEIVSLPESGNSIVLWLDSELQKKIEEVLEKTLKNVGAKKGVAVALNPKTGGVMALVSLPSFDNNLFSKGVDPEALKNLLNDPQQPLFNRVISGLYPTGSTIKPLIAAAALEEKIISSTKNIDCQGKITIPHSYDPKIVTEKNDWRIHGWTNMQKAIAESCNVYFYTIGGGYGNQEGLGPSRIKKYLELFGWGDKTGINLPGEAKGLIPSPDWKKEIKKENWWDGDTYNLSIGQGDISVTPLQVATAFVAIANGGTLFKPQVAKQIVDSEKNIIEEIKPKVIRENFINSGNLKIVREGMRKAVTGEGSPFASSIILNSLPVPAAAKTGTAQTSKANYYHNWVTVFAPYDDPQIVLTVMIENVKEAQVVALPIAKEILEWYFSR